MVTWRGVFPAVTTQMNEDESLNLDATVRHLEILGSSGVSGVVMLGSLGENNSLSSAEKLDVLRIAVATFGNRLPVIAGVSELTTAAACDYVREAERIGVSGFMVLPAMVYPADTTETIAHFRRVASATSLDILVYNNPVAYKIDLGPEAMAVLSEIPNLKAIKESSADPRRITDLFNVVGDRYAIFAGVDDLICESMAMGAVGWIAGVGLAYPRENQQLFDLLESGRFEEARQLYRWFAPLMHLDVGPKFVQKIKLALQEQGMGREWVRMPRQVLSGAEREATLAVIRAAEAKRPVLV